MADFDTAAKRFSGMGMEANEAPLLPIPSGAFDQADRQHLLDLYSGILASGAAVSTVVFRKTLSSVGTRTGARQVHGNN